MAYKLVCQLMVIIVLLVQPHKEILRLISVILDADEENSAFIETKKLLQYGFDPTSYSALQAFKDVVTSWTIYCFSLKI